MEKSGHPLTASAAYSTDRKSTRLNSSHTVISYAVFCLKKKKHTSELQSHSDTVCRLLLESKEPHMSYCVALPSDNGSPAYRIRDRRTETLRDVTNAADS